MVEPFLYFSFRAFLLTTILKLLLGVWVIFYTSLPFNSHFFLKILYRYPFFFLLNVVHKQRKKEIKRKIKKGNTCKVYQPAESKEERSKKKKKKKKGNTNSNKTNIKTNDREYSVLLNFMKILLNITFMY